MTTAARATIAPHIWLALGILGIVAALAYAITTHQAENTQWVDHTYRVIETLDEAEQSLVRMQSARRGFTLTGDEVDLHDFAKAEKNLESARATARSRTVDNRSQQERLDRLDPLLAEFLSLQQSAIARRQTEGFVLDREAASTREIRAAIDKIDPLLVELTGEERRLLVERSAATSRSLLHAKLAHVFGTSVSVVVILFAFAGQRRENSRRAEAELATRAAERGRVEGEARFARLVDALPFGVMVFDFPSATPGDVVVSYANAQSSIESMIDSKALVGRSLKQSLPVEFENGVEPPYLVRLRRVAEAGGREFLEVVRGERTLECHYVSLDSRSVALIYHDVTEKRLADKALHDVEVALRDSTIREKAEARFRALVESAPDAMVIFADDGHIVLVNDQTEKLFGYGRSELLGQPVNKLVPEMNRGKFGPGATGYVTGRKAGSLDARIEQTALRKDGTEIPIEASITVVEMEDGTFVSSTIRDVSDRKATEVQLRESENALQLANQELEAFSYSVAHDLRAPLRGMNGFAQVLLNTQKDKLDAEAQDWLQEILSNARKMGELIDALLSLARVTRSDLLPMRIDLSVIAKVAASQLAAADPERSVEVVIEPSLLAQVDPRLARAVFDNLLGNAWKFTKSTADARITVGTTTVNGAQAFFVHDNGAGFDMAYAGKLFAPFQRLHTVAEFPGTGIGLATVQRIIHRHGGRIWAEGRVDEGATFYFTLPGKLSEA